MSPPGVWGPAVWTLFHVLADRINEQAYSLLYLQLFQFIKRICANLPCPDCAKDATMFLAKVNVQSLKTKNDLIKVLYLFHNYVNKKKNKPLYNYTNINFYKKLKLVNVVNNFMIHFNTKGNMNLISESFQRQMLLKEFKPWMQTNMRYFIPVNKPIGIPDQPIVENKT